MSEGGGATQRLEMRSEGLAAPGSVQHDQRENEHHYPLFSEQLRYHAFGLCMDMKCADQQMFNGASTADEAKAQLSVRHTCCDAVDGCTPARV